MTSVFLLIDKNSGKTRKLADVEEEAADLFKRLDANQDGEVTMEEFVAGMLEDACAADSLGPDAAATRAAEFTQAIKDAVFAERAQKASGHSTKRNDHKGHKDHKDNEHHHHSHHGDRESHSRHGHREHHHRDHHNHDHHDRKSHKHD